MEIFRTDGGGRYENPTRLIRTVGIVMDRIPYDSSIWNNIKSVEDHKGELTITFNREFANSLDETYVLYQFMKAWAKFGESTDNVFIKYAQL